MERGVRNARGTHLKEVPEPVVPKDALKMAKRKQNAYTPPTIYP